MPKKKKMKRSRLFYFYTCGGTSVVEQLRSFFFFFFIFFFLPAELLSPSMAVGEGGGTWAWGAGQRLGEERLTRAPPPLAGTPPPIGQTMEGRRRTCSASRGSGLEKKKKKKRVRPGHVVCTDHRSKKNKTKKRLIQACG